MVPTSRASGGNAYGCLIPLVLIILLYDVYGVKDTKTLKKRFGLQLDMRYKASWVSLARQAGLLRTFAVIHCGHPLVA